ncbi:MAG: flagellar basal-body rod protein FlgG [Lachnospiraceae bacterium]|nr:flagellar basal-body rod protein FlgG [Lachnospiraceae bacterium]
MMRSLWTAASGMKAQQTAMDNLSNNLANINTTGYKKERLEFQSLLYQNIQRRTTDNEGNPKPIGAQVGLGVKVAAISTEFEQGELTNTNGDFDFAIQGEGFFMIEMPDGTTAYTRNGHFGIGMLANGYQLSTAEGYPVLDSQGNPITFDAATDVSKLSFDNYGRIMYRADDGNAYLTGVTIGAAQFNNPAGLSKIGDSYFIATAASGEARIEGQDDALTISIIKNKYLEHSSVQAVDEMVDMIITQRAYEMNSKAITASDEMLQQANNLRA